MTEQGKIKLNNEFKLKRLQKIDKANMTQDEITKLHNVPSISELHYARLYLIKEAQKFHYKDEYKALIKGEPIQEKSQLIKFNPTIKDGVIIMQSRLLKGLRS